MPTVSNKQVISAMYSAVFNRAPDAVGLIFWEVQFAANAGNAVKALAAGFTNHPVFTETYGAMDNLTFVQAIYQNVLGGAGETAGIVYWDNQLSSGVTRADMLASFVEGALIIDLPALKAAGQLTDAEFTAAVVRQNQLTNKANVGLQFAALLGEKSNLDPATDTTTIAGLEADPAYRASQAAIRSVTNDDQTALDAIAFLTAAAATADPIAFINANAAVAEQTFTLTSAVEALVGTSGNDTFIAGDEDGIATLNAGDSIQGGAGTDTLKLSNAVGALNTDNFALATISGVENVEATLSATVQTLDVSSSADVNKVTLVTTGVDGAADNVLALTAADNQAVVVTGSHNLTLTTTAATGTTGFSIDGSAFTGKLTVTGTAASDIIKGGSGNDIISGGAGTTVADTLTGGAGNDKFIVIAGATSTTFDTITDFTANADTISFGAAVLPANYTTEGTGATDFTTALIAANLALANTNIGIIGGVLGVLGDVLGGVLGVVGDPVTQVNVQQVGDDSYVFYNDGLLAGADMAVKLTGVALAGIEAAYIVA